MRSVFVNCSFIFSIPKFFRFVSALQFADYHGGFQQDPASTKRRVLPSPRLKPLSENNHRNHVNTNENNGNVNNNLHLEANEPRNISPEVVNSVPDRGEMDRNASVLDIKPSTIKVSVFHCFWLNKQIRVMVPRQIC